MVVLGLGWREGSGPTKKIPKNLRLSRSCRWLNEHRACISERRLCSTTPSCAAPLPLLLPPACSLGGVCVSTVFRQKSSLVFRTTNFPITIFAPLGFNTNNSRPRIFPNFFSEQQFPHQQFPRLFPPHKTSSQKLKAKICLEFSIPTSYFQAPSKICRLFFSPTPFPHDNPPPPTSFPSHGLHIQTTA